MTSQDKNSYDKIKAYLLRKDRFRHAFAHRKKKITNQRTYRYSSFIIEAIRCDICNFNDIAQKSTATHRKCVKCSNHAASAKNQNRSLQYLVQSPLYIAQYTTYVLSFLAFVLYTINMSLQKYYFSGIQ